MKKVVAKKKTPVSKEAHGESGRKEAYTPEQMVKALKETKGMVYLAASRLGCAPQTVYNYAKKYEVVKAELDSQRGEVLDTAELALYNAMLRGEAWAVCFTLKTIGKDRGYTERHEVRLEDVDVTKLSNAELLAILNSKGAG